VNSLPGQVHCPEAVLKTAVYRTGVDKACEPELPDVAQPLKPLMTYEVIDKLIWYTDESVYRVIDNLSLVSQTAWILWMQIYSIVFINGKEKLHIQVYRHILV